MTQKDREQRLLDTLNAMVKNDATAIQVLINTSVRTDSGHDVACGHVLSAAIEALTGKRLAAQMDESGNFPLLVGFTLKGDNKPESKSTFDLTILAIIATTLYASQNQGKTLDEESQESATQEAVLHAMKLMYLSERCAQ